MGESRTELLAWVNDLLQLNYTKVEQAGTGMNFERVKKGKLIIHHEIYRCCLLSNYGFCI